MASLSPELIFNAGNFPVTNTIISTIAVDALLLTLVYIIYKNISMVPSTLQLITEQAFDYFNTLTEQIAKGRESSIFPWFMTFFIVILFSNLFGLLPGVGSIGIFKENVEYGKELIPLFRASTSDFNATFAFATISLVATHTLSIKYIGIAQYLKKFFSFNPIYLFVGILELVSEFVKMFSLSFRLFGNIFAGEVVLATVSELFAFIVPIPFILLESIVALVQALVFAMLTMTFMAILTTSHAEEGGGH